MKRVHRPLSFRISTLLIQDVIKGIVPVGAMTSIHGHRPAECKISAINPEGIFMRSGSACRLLAVSAFTFVAFGCSSSVQDTVVGKWQPPEQGESIEYLKDGSAVVTSGGKSVTGKWAALDDSRIKFELTENGKPVVFTYKVTFFGKDEMSTLGEKNQITKFTRIK